MTNAQIKNKINALKSEIEALEAQITVEEKPVKLTKVQSALIEKLSDDSRSLIFDCCQWHWEYTRVDGSRQREQYSDVRPQTIKALIEKGLLIESSVSRTFEIEGSSRTVTNKIVEVA